MKSLKPLIGAFLLTVVVSSSAAAGNIGGMKATSAGNIGGLRTNRVGNIGGLRTGAPTNVDESNPTVPNDPPSRVEISLFENFGGFLSILISAF